MKKRGRLGALLVVLCLVLCLTTPAASAAKPYQYTVTISGGAYGTVNGSTTLTFNYGEIWNARDYSVTETNPKYQFKGFRISGQEDLVGAMRVTKDVHLVAAYGIPGQLVAYVVNYLDRATGEALHESETFYGTVDERAVVPYLYIENYQPEGLSYVKTLTENEADNVIDIYYNSLTAANPNGDNANTNPNGENPNGENPNGDNANGNHDEENPNGENPNGDGTEVIGDDETPLADPQDVIDLDDDETPLAPGISDIIKHLIPDATNEAIILYYIRNIGIAVGAALLGVGLWYFLFFRRRKQRQKEKSDQ
ncbi:MAG: hypothetical protein IJ751_06025 [Oscillospiraceae bacterium]|nr:hypothetical protein [Oscillospiraceae bacterium]